MDQRKNNSDRGLCWTNERHVDFLNTMEASFVRTMFENNGLLLPLDRYLPDSSESTLDLKKERRRRFSTSDIMDPSVTTDRKGRRRLLSQPYTSSKDQVVPQSQSRRDDKKEKAHPGVPITPAAPTN
ncbi:unnamed protein product [Ilex paraguariensis]|uniref:Uncharacterized protein n=1 Tax=Ilex paraguariensis TaxID=185542 RepID=A0ABC8QVZ9_9AQUA